MKERPEKFKLEWHSTPDLCDASAVLYQLSYQANWELVVMQVDDNPLDIKIICILAVVLSFTYYLSGTHNTVVIIL